MKKTVNKKIRLVLRGHTIRELRHVTEQELEQALGAVGCGTPQTSYGQDICTSPH